jgi:GT2 family glycosyltransferase
MISPKIKGYTNKEYLWNAGAKINFRSANISRIRGLWEYDPNDQKYNEISLTDYAVGTALFVKKEVIDKIGLLDEIFFMYFEETEWNFRAKKNGYKNYYVPTTIVYHKVTPIINKRVLVLKQFFLTRNAQILVWKHAKCSDILIFYFKFSFRNLRIILVALMNREFYIVFLRICSLLQGFRIGIKKRSNRSCRKLLIKDYYFIIKNQKRIQLLKI